MHDLLRERGAGHIKIFGGGGGVIISEEIDELEAYGIAKIFSPDDGMRIGLQGIINLMLEQCDYPILDFEFSMLDSASDLDPRAVARTLSTIENKGEAVSISVGTASAEKHAPTASGDGSPIAESSRTPSKIPTVGITGTGGAGKSTLTDEHGFYFDFYLLARRRHADGPPGDDQRRRGGL